MADEGGEVLLVAALRRELAGVRRRTRVSTARVVGGVRLAGGELGSRRVLLAATGDGEPSARSGLAAVLELWRPAVAVVLGVAGALTKGLETGRLLVATAHGRPGRVEDAPGSAWLDKALGLDDVATGVVLSVERIASTAAAKTELLRRHREAAGGATGPCVVDLETAAYVSVLQQAEVPYVVIRAVSDEADEDLPLDFERFRDSQGRIRESRVLLYALTHPRVLPSLDRLRVRVGRCASRLGAAVERLVSPTP